MPSKKKSATEKELKAEVKKLRSSLADAEAAGDRWRKKAKKRRSDAARSQARVTELEKRLQKAAGGTVADPAPAALPEPSSPSAPDDSWTVIRLRAEARSRGVAGYSQKSKAQLLDALR